MSDLRVVGRGARACDGCTACCELLEIEELSKPAFTRCQYQGEGKCTNYKDRPSSCADWDCLWLHGYMPDRFSPQRCGVMFTPQRIGASKSFGMQIVGARELSRSSSKIKSGARAIQWLVSRGVSVLVQIESGVKHFYPAKGARAFAAAVYRKRGIDHQWNGRYFIINGG